MTELLKTLAVCRTFGEFVALQNVSFGVASGETVSIVGPNGAGKSTLVNLLTGLLRPTSGTVTFRGKDIGGVGPQQLARLGMARGFQLIEIFPTLTVRQTIGTAVVSALHCQWDWFQSALRNATIAQRIVEVSRLFDLEGKLDAEAQQLSQGHKKLLDIASAFALNPEVILLDEPTSGVATADKHGIMRTMIDAAQASGVKAMLLVEHDMDLVSDYSSRVIALQAGRLLADLPPCEFFADPVLCATIAGRVVRH